MRVGFKSSNFLISFNLFLAYCLEDKKQLGNGVMWFWLFLRNDGSCELILKLLCNILGFNAIYLSETELEVVFSHSSSF